VGNLATATPQLFDVPEVVRSLEHELTYLLVKCLTEREAPTLCTRALRHEAIVARFEDYLEANQNTPLYLAQVCEAIGTAERTLRAACEQHLGLGPIRYLALRRMNLTRRALMAADPSTATVTQIATEFGFWELGRFSVAYRALFGETPSATLRRPAVDVREPFTRPSSLPGIARARGS
jgi:transcriptional regulator GlxA family with amidase domain